MIPGFKLRRKSDLDRIFPALPSQPSQIGNFWNITARQQLRSGLKLLIELYGFATPNTYERYAFADVEKRQNFLRLAELLADDLKKCSNKALQRRAERLMKVVATEQKLLASSPIQLKYVVKSQLDDVDPYLLLRTAH